VGNSVHVGDSVIWRGGFGAAAGVTARVTGIERVEEGEKYGEQVAYLAWSDATGRRAVIDLDNGHWAYAGQLTGVTR
jgi:hypothetical protein